MAARKKVVVAQPVPTPKPKRYTVGYEFPVTAKITDIEVDRDGTAYRVEVALKTKYAGDYEEVCLWVDSADLDELEIAHNPEAQVALLQDKLSEAQLLVDKYIAELTALTKK